MTRVLAIDPGTTVSAWLTYVDGAPVRFGICPNAKLVDMLRESSDRLTLAAVVIEQIESYGMPVGREVFETVRWAGRFEQAADPIPVVLLTRRVVKLYLTGSPRANDGNVRMALIDRFGGKEAAIGRKAAPGPLYGITKDAWSALAIAVTHADMNHL